MKLTKDVWDTWNGLPAETRHQYIKYLSASQIDELEHEKKNAIKAHKANLDRINKRLKYLSEWMKKNS